MKKIFLLLSIVFIYSCGFSPIYLYGKEDIHINLKKIEGDFELNSYIRNDLMIASNKNSLNVYDVKANTKYEKIILTKNATGDPTDYRLDFSVKFIIVSENKEVSFKESFKIKKNDKNFEQSNYEREIKRNFSEIIRDKLILYLLNLNDS